jgi:hypothetical protein
MAGDVADSAGHGSPRVVRTQWLNYPTPGIPRLANGAPNLKAPAPARPTASQIFPACGSPTLPSRDFCREKDCIQEERMAREQINLGIKLKDGLPYTDWSKEQMKVRRANGGREDPHSYCMPPNFPRAWTLPQHTRIVQTPGMMVMLHEFNAAYREVYLDGRPLPSIRIRPGTATPQGAGKATRWSSRPNGIRDDMWLDIQGSPITESGRVTERLKRRNLGLMQVEIARERSQGLHEAVSVTIEMALIVDTQMLEESAWTTRRIRSFTNDAHISPVGAVRRWDLDFEFWDLGFATCATRLAIIPSPSTTHAQSRRRGYGDQGWNGKARTRGSIWM